MFQIKQIKYYLLFNNIIHKKERGKIEKKLLTNNPQRYPQFKPLIYKYINELSTFSTILL